MTKENKEIIPLEEQPYAVPKNWQWVKGKKIFKSMETKKPNGKVFYYIDIDSIDNKKQCITNPKKLKVIDAPSRASRKLHEGDTIFSMVRPYLRNIAYIDATLENCIASTGFFVCSPKEKLLPIYFYYLMISEYVVSNFTKQMKGDNSPSIRKSDVENFLYPIAPIEEQKRIVECITEQFSKLDKAKERIQSVLDSSETRKAAILHKAFTGELTASWRKENKQEMFRDNVLFDSCIEKMQNGLSKRKGDEGEDRIVLRLINIQDTGIDLSDIRKIKLNKNEQEKYSLQKNDSIMIRVNGSKNNVGKQVLLTETINNLSFCDHLIRIQYKNNVLPKYMIYFSKTETYKRYVEKNMVSSAGQNTISRKGLKNLYVPVFTLEEQREIVRILDDLLTKEQRIVDIAAATLQRIDTMKQAILAKAFRGELGTNDPSEPPAPLTAKGDLSC